MLLAQCMHPPGPRFSFTQGSYNVSEGVGIAEVCIELIAGTATADVEIEIFTQEGSAIGCKFESHTIQPLLLLLNLFLTINIVDDFVVTDGITSLTFPSSSTVGAMGCIQVSIIDDDTAEGIEDFLVTFNSSDSVVEINPGDNQAIVSIVDNDGETPVGFSEFKS